MGIALKIVYFSYLYDIKGISAGSANKALGFVGGLRRLGHTVSVYWRSIQPEDLEKEMLWYKLRARLKAKLSRYLHDPKKLFSNFPFAIQEYQILQQEKPDLLFLRNELYIVSAQCVARLLHIPVVLEVDCPNAYEHRYMVPLKRMVLPVFPEWIERWNWKMSQAIITISEVLRNYLVENGVPPVKITVIPNGADPEVFKPLPKAQTLRSRFGIPEKAVVIGWSGSLYGWSGLEQVLDVLKRILASRKEVVLLFVGGGKNQEIIEQAFPPDMIGKRVFLTGTVPYSEVPQYLHLMDVVLVPYPKRAFWYPSSMKLFEYMACQKAIVASSVPQVDQVIQDNVNGFLYPPENFQTMEEKLLQCIDSPALRKWLGKNARLTVLQNYTWLSHAKRMEEVFHQVLSSHHS